MTKDESERGSSLVVARGEIVKAKQGDSVARERAREHERRRRTSQIKRMEEVEKKRRKKKNGDTAGREAARLARQVQRARAREDANSHNYSRVVELRADFDTFRERKRTSPR